MPIDFQADDLTATLAAHGYRADARTLFVWEGVTQYLTEDAVRDTLAALASAPSGSVLVFSYVRHDFLDGVELYGDEPTYRRFVRPGIWRFVRPASGVSASTRRTSPPSGPNTAGTNRTKSATPNSAPGTSPPTPHRTRLPTRTLRHRHQALISSRSALSAHVSDSPPQAVGCGGYVGSR
ncbi:class I SAM-dependent methyltransferase [Nocardia gipuzkoensis]